MSASKKGVAGVSGHDPLLERFQRALVEEIHSRQPEYLRSSFTVAEIYQELIPYRSHRDVLGVEMNGDYEHALLRLLAGEGGFLTLESEPSLQEIRNELLSSNPNTSLYRKFAAAEVRLNPDRVAEPSGSSSPDASTEASPDGAEETRSQGSSEAPPAAPGDPVPDTAGPDEAGPDEAGPEALEVEAPRGGEESGSSGTPVLPFERPRGPEVDGQAVGQRCPRCDEDLPDRAGLRFCQSCGAHVLTLSCSSCGDEMEPGWRYCVSCGAQAAH